MGNRRTRTGSYTTVTEVTRGAEARKERPEVEAVKKRQKKHAG